MTPNRARGSQLVAVGWQDGTVDHSPDREEARELADPKHEGSGGGQTPTPHLEPATRMAHVEATLALVLERVRDLELLLQQAENRIDDLEASR
jgi:hypothetical protein